MVKIGARQSQKCLFGELFWCNLIKNAYVVQKQLPSSLNEASAKVAKPSQRQDIRPMASPTDLPDHWFRSQIGQVFSRQIASSAAKTGVLRLLITKSNHSGLDFCCIPQIWVPFFQFLLSKPHFPIRRIWKHPNNYRRSDKKSLWWSVCWGLT